MFSISAQPIAHGDGAVDLAAALHRVDQPADVGGVHAVQDADLAGDAMHGEPNALHVEGDGARRQVGLAPDLEAMTGRGAGGMELGQRDPLVAADDGVVVEPALVAVDAGMAAAKSRMLSRSASAVSAPPCPATTVPVLAKVPVS